MRLVGMLAVTAASVTVINWLLSGGLLRLLVAAPVLWLLVAGLPMAAVLAVLIPDRPRTVRIPVPVFEGDGPLEVDVQVHHHHHHVVIHEHRYRADVTEQHALRRAPAALSAPRRVALGRGGPVIDGSVVSDVRATGERQ